MSFHSVVVAQPSNVSPARTCGANGHLARSCGASLRVYLFTMKSVIAAGVTLLIAASTSLADTPVNATAERNEKVTEKLVFVTGSLIPRRIKVRSVGTTTESSLRVIDRREIDATGRGTTPGAFVNEPSVRILGH
jgi:hypothetical protein